MIVGEFEYREYTTIVKALARADLDIMDLIHRQQEIIKLQCELIQEKKSIDHKLNCRIATPNKSWTPLCIDSCLYAYRVYMVCTFEDKDSGRGRESIYGPHLQ